MNRRTTFLQVMSICKIFFIFVLERIRPSENSHFSLFDHALKMMTNPTPSSPVLEHPKSTSPGGLNQVKHEIQHSYHGNLIKKHLALFQYSRYARECAIL